jgi:hypothetical protein
MKALGQFVNTIAASIFGAYVFTILWGWFAVVIFGAPVITIPMALGIALLVRYYTWQSSLEQASEGHQAHQRVVAWVKPVACLLVGFIIKQFM